MVFEQTRAALIAGTHIPAALLFVFAWFILWFWWISLVLHVKTPLRSAPRASTTTAPLQHHLLAPLKRCAAWALSLCSALLKPFTRTRPHTFCPRCRPLSCHGQRHGDTQYLIRPYWQLSALWELRITQSSWKASIFTDCYLGFIVNSWKPVRPDTKLLGLFCSQFYIFIHENNQWGSFCGFEGCSVF